ncbi:MAG: NADH-quinone oxidoreductase subunit A [Desulfobulbaceae bacterium]|nr:NADH-quinone oxidoreductase subunit A [Desulfobulbaceae bacterium]
MLPIEHGAFSSAPPDLLAMTLYTLMVFGLMGVILFLTSRLGEKKTTDVKLSAYESGITPTGTARFSYPAPFYLVAIFFLIFDVEAAYIFSWAIAFDQLGWKGWFQITFFIFILLGSLLYLWQKGGLDWATARQQK